MDKKVLITLLVYTLIILSSYLIILLLSPFLGSIVWASVLALTFYPLQKRLLKLLKGNKNLSAMISTTIVFLIIAIPLFFLGIIFASEAQDILSKIEDFLYNKNFSLTQLTEKNESIAKLIEKLKPYINEEDIHKAAINIGKWVGGVILLASKKFTIGFFKGLFELFFTLILLFFSFRDGEVVVSTLWEILGLRDSDREKIKEVVKRIINAVLFGIIFACVAQGILGGIGFAIAGIPSPVFYGVLMTLAAFLPAVGTSLIWVPAVIYLFIVKHYGSAIFLLIWSIIVVSFIDNIIRPLYISGKAKISLPIIVLGVIGGLITLGFLGIILGPLILSLFLEGLRIYKEEILPQKGSENSKEIT